MLANVAVTGSCVAIVARVAALATVSATVAGLAMSRQGAEGSHGTSEIFQDLLVTHGVRCALQILVLTARAPSARAGLLGTIASVSC